MNDTEKRARMAEHLSSLGVPQSTFAPPFYRLLWRFGIDAPPPLFTGFVPLALAQGGLFGIFWGVAMWAVVRVTGLFIPTLFIAVAAAIAGALFGVTMATLIRWKARQLGLPPWPQY